MGFSLSIPPLAFIQQHLTIIHSRNRNRINCLPGISCIYRMKKYFPRLLLLLVILLAIGYLVSWKSPAYYLPQKAYNPSDSIVLFGSYTGEHPRPMIVTQPGLVIFGAAHTRNPDAPEIKQMEAEWKRLQPTVALVEGRLGFLFPGLMDPVKTLGEGGAVKHLAHRDGIRIYNWDLSKEALAQQLEGEKFTKDQIALQQILNPYFSNLRFGKPASPENFVEEYLKRAAYVNLQDSIKNVADVDRYWKKYFPSGPDWREVSDEHTLPGFLAPLMAFSNDLRNQQLVAAVKELTAKGEKVFVVCGSSHAYCVAPAFR